MLDLRAEMKQETLNFDQSCHRITGLGVNWALSIQLSAQTMAGEGPLSRKLSGGNSQICFSVSPVESTRMVDLASVIYRSALFFVASRTECAY